MNQHFAQLLVASLALVAAAPQPRMSGSSIPHPDPNLEVGDGPRAFDRIIGHPLEFVPLADPAAAKVASDLRMRLLFQGQPLAGVRVHAGVAPTTGEAPNPILRVLSSIEARRVRALLMGGQAGILYGAAEFSRDTDFAVLASPLASPANLARLRQALDDLRAEVIAVPPFETKYLRRGHAVHFRCRHRGRKPYPAGTASTNARPVWSTAEAITPGRPRAGSRRPITTSPEFSATAHREISSATLPRRTVSAVGLTGDIPWVRSRNCSAAS